MKMVTTQLDGPDADGEWLAFPGGELEGKRPNVLCYSCRQALRRTLWSGRPGAATGRAARRNRALCFACYRAGMARESALKAAGELNTASADRFQTALPFEPINQSRLEMLKVDRLTTRARHAATTSGVLTHRRRQAQIAARHALQRIAAALAARRATRADHARVMAAAIHAAELQLPESWLPFVVAR